MKYRDIKERLLSRVHEDVTTGCWNWVGATRRGYGRVLVGSRRREPRRSVSAHRLSYETFIGPIPQGMQVCHHCDNRSCINPVHLFLGTLQMNIDDRERKGRNNHVRGERIGTAKLTAGMVAKARELRRDGMSIPRLALMFRVHRKTIWQAVNGQHWAHVLPAPPASGEGT